MDKPKPMSATARAVLSLAATRDDHLVQLPRLPVAAARQVARSLLGSGLAEEAPASDDRRPWKVPADHRLPRRWVGLRILFGDASLASPREVRRSEVLDRIHQVGPDKQGAKGSYSIYRVGQTAEPEPDAPGRAMLCGSTLPGLGPRAGPQRPGTGGAADQRAGCRPVQAWDASGRLSRHHLQQGRQPGPGFQAAPTHCRQLTRCWWRPGSIASPGAPHALVVAGGRGSTGGATCRAGMAG